MPARPIPVLSAPTAAGKSALALDLSQSSPLEIISADAFTVYRGLDIGTAKPTPAERTQVPHHLIDVADVREPFDVARFVALAETAIGDVLARGRIPLVVGGTGFYLAALIHGLPLTPPADLAVRAAVETELQERGLDALLAEIGIVDPAEERRMERNPRRVVRAVELLRRTGKLPGHYGRSTPQFTYTVTAFTHPHAELETRIRARLSAMLAAGWPEEAAWLARQVSPEGQPQPTVWQALGYREALAVQRRELAVPDALERLQTATRQYAKRQLTFMRTQLRVPLLDRLGAERHLHRTLERWR